jgi:hypothetical protein
MAAHTRRFFVLLLLFLQASLPPGTFPQQPSAGSSGVLQLLDCIALYSMGALGCFLSARSLDLLLVSRLVMGFGGGALLVRTIILAGPFQPVTCFDVRGSLTSTCGVLFCLSPPSCVYSSPSAGASEICGSSPPESPRPYMPRYSAS